MEMNITSAPWFLLFCIIWAGDFWLPPTQNPYFNCPQNRPRYCRNEIHPFLLFAATSEKPTKTYTADVWENRQLEGGGLGRSHQKIEWNSGESIFPRFSIRRMFDIR